MRFLSMVLGFAALYGCAGRPVQVREEQVRSKPLQYSEFSRFLEARHQGSNVYSLHFQRDSSGAKLFVSFYFRQTNEPAHRTLIVARDGFKEVPGYPKVWYDDHENALFRLEGARRWYETDGKSQRFFSRWDESHYILKNSVVIPYKELKAVSGMDGVVGGDFLLVRFRDKPWIISALKNPSRALVELPPALDHPQGAYVRGRDFVFFGSWRPASGHFVKCLIYQPAADGYRLSEEIRLPWAGTVYDFDPKTGDALVSGMGQFTSYYRFNIKTKKRARLGFAPSDNVLFLQDGVIRVLDSALGKSK